MFNTTGYSYVHHILTLRQAKVGLRQLAIVIYYHILNLRQAKVGLRQLAIVIYDIISEI